MPPVRCRWQAVSNPKPGVYRISGHPQPESNTRLQAGVFMNGPQPGWNPEQAISPHKNRPQSRQYLVAQAMLDQWASVPETT